MGGERFLIMKSLFSGPGIRLALVGQLQQIIHAHIMEQRQIAKHLRRDGLLPCLVVGIRPLCQIDFLTDLCLRQIRIFP